MSYRTAFAVWAATALTVFGVTVAWQYGAIFNPLNTK